MMKELLLASWDQAPWVAIVVFFVLGTSFAIPKCLKIILFFVLCLKMIDNGADEIDFFGGKISKSKSRAKDDINHL